MKWCNYLILLILVFLFIFTLPFSLSAQVKEPVSLKGVIVKLELPKIFIKKSGEKEIEFSVSKDTVFVKENLLCSINDFVPGESVYCFYEDSASAKKLVALVDTESGNNISDESGSNWLQAFEKALYGEKEIVRGTVSKVNKEVRTVRLLTGNGKEKDLYIMQDLLLLDKNQLIDFSWDKVKNGNSLEAIGYKKDKKLNVFYIQLGKVTVKNSSLERRFGTFTGVISSLDIKNQIIEIKDMEQKQLRFKITGDTVMFNWELGEKADFKALLKGQKVKIESIASIDSIGEAIILEVGDSDLYY